MKILFWNKNECALNLWKKIYQKNTRETITSIKSPINKILTWNINIFHSEIDSERSSCIYFERSSNMIYDFFSLSAMTDEWLRGIGSGKKKEGKFRRSIGNWESQVKIINNINYGISYFRLMCMSFVCILLDICSWNVLMIVKILCWWLLMLD